MRDIGLCESMGRVMVEIHLKRKIFVKICVKTCVNCVECVRALRTVNADRDSLKQYEYHPRALCAPSSRVIVLIPVRAGGTA